MNAGTGRLASAAPADLLGRVLEFGEALRRAGIGVTPGRLLDALRSVALVGLASRDCFRLALRTNVVGSRDEEILFDRAFDAFWSGTALEVRPDERALERRQEARGREIVDSRRELRGRRAEYSAAAATGEKDLLAEWPGGSREMERMIRELADRLATRPSRRFRPTPRGRRVDLRRAFRRHLATGGELFDLARRTRKLRKTRIVLICDVSGSMDADAPFLLEMLVGLQKAVKSSRTVVFSTQVTEVTRELRRRSVAEALAAIGAEARHWSGGTDIGGALARVNRCVLREGSPSSTVALIVSDGYDQGDPLVVAREMAALRRRSRTIVWVNPLLGSEGYAPIAKGMRAALPYVDHFLPAHDVASLRALCRTLGAV